MRRANQELVITAHRLTRVNRQPVPLKNSIENVVIVNDDDGTTQ